MGFPPNTTPAAGSLTNAMLADMAASRVKGRAAGAGTGAPTDLTPTQLTALLNAFTDTLPGAVPASGGGTANFLRADGSFATPVAGRLAHCRISKEANQNGVLDGAKITFDNLIYDPSGLHDTVNKEKFTANATGEWRLWVMMQASGGGVFGCGIVTNNATLNGYYGRWRYSGTPTQQGLLTWYEGQLNSGDSMWVQCDRTSGTANFLGGGGTPPAANGGEYALAMFERLS